MPGRLEGRTAIVLGGARGIGEGVVSVLVREGAKVVVSDVLADLGGEVASRHAGKTTFFRADIARRADMQALAMTVLGVRYQPGMMLSAVAEGRAPWPEWAVRFPVFLLTLLAVYLLWRFMLDRTVHGCR